MKYEIIKSELIKSTETHVYTLEKQQVSIVRINGKPVEAIIRPGKLSKEEGFLVDTGQEGLRINIEDSRITALIKVLKEVYGDI